MAQDAPQVEQIEHLVQSADFTAAEARAVLALRSGKLHRSGVARVYLQMGIIASAKRLEEPSLHAFTKALSLEPSSTLPESAGPHIIEAFDKAKGSTTRSPRLSVTV